MSHFHPSNSLYSGTISPAGPERGLGRPLPVHAVGYGDFQPVEIVQHVVAFIMISDVTPFIMTEQLQRDHVEPAAAAGPPVVAPNSMPIWRVPLAVFVGKVRSGTVRCPQPRAATGLEDAVHVADARRQLRPDNGTNAGAERVRRRDEGISAEIDVQHRTLRSFGEHRVILVEQGGSPHAGCRSAGNA